MSGYNRLMSENNSWQWQKDCTGQQIAFCIYTGNDRQYRWSAIAANHEKIANGGEGYHNRGDCVAGARRMGFSGV